MASVSWHLTQRIEKAHRSQTVEKTFSKAKECSEQMLQESSKTLEEEHSRVVAIAWDFL